MQPTIKNLTEKTLLANTINAINKANGSDLKPARAKSRAKELISEQFGLNNSNMIPLLFNQEQNKSPDTKTPPAILNEYRVNVRALVTVNDDADSDFITDFDFPPCWEVYDVGQSTIRLDTPVIVSATSKERAIELAKGDAPSLNLEHEPASFGLWVDETLDTDVLLDNPNNSLTKALEVYTSLLHVDGWLSEPFLHFKKGNSVYLAYDWIEKEFNVSIDDVYNLKIANESEETLAPEHTLYDVLSGDISLEIDGNFCRNIEVTDMETFKREGGDTELSAIEVDIDEFSYSFTFEEIFNATRNEELKFWTISTERDGQHEDFHVVIYDLKIV